MSRGARGRWRVGVSVAVLVAAAGAEVGAGQAPWWDVGPGRVVENDFGAMAWYREGCLDADRVARDREAGVTSFDPRALSPGRCASSAGFRLDTVHWMNRFMGVHFGGDAGWVSVDRGLWRVGIESGVRVGPALGWLRPWADLGTDLGYSDGSTWLDADGLGLSLVAGVGVDIGRRFGVRAGVRRRWPVVGAGPGHRYFSGHRHLAGGLLAWEFGPLVRF